mmetsp:Transcript_35164/g.48939  ORF Transcript_35164/g.48939 Transcript_35164/m.48939 type:complete len:117 (+) Transcript_35164:1062-1412(+)
MDMLGLICDTIELAASGQRLSPMKKFENIDNNDEASSHPYSPSSTSSKRSNNLDEKYSRRSNELENPNGSDISEGENSGHCNNRKAAPTAASGASVAVWSNYQNNRLQRRTVRCIH